MVKTSQETLQVLLGYNPWWIEKRVSGIPAWKRTLFRELDVWLHTPPAPRAILLSGARQTGKTTLLLQAIQTLVDNGVPPQNVLYATFDHPLLKQEGLERVVQLWREHEAPAEGPEYLLLDEIQSVPEWQVWLKHQVDFFKQRRIVVTGSATPLRMEGQESGVGRWHTIHLSTLSFFEYLHLKDIAAPALSEISSLSKLFDWSMVDFTRAGETARELIPHFHDYLLRGGFPQCALMPDVDIAQRLLREDIVDKVLKRDMTSLFGVRRVFELEKTFLYLCLHDGGLLDMTALSKNLEMTKSTVNNFLALLEAAHLIHRLPPHGYGKEILRARHKVYLADAAMASSVMLRGKSMLQDAALMGQAVETTLYTHLLSRYGDAGAQFSYWRGKKNEEVDIVMEAAGRLVPFEVKYRLQHTGLGDLTGIAALCAEKKIACGHVITREINDFGLLPIESEFKTTLVKIPAPLACYWLGQPATSSSPGLDLLM